MANVYGKIASWAAREAEEYAAKHSVSIQRAIEAIEEKYGQKIFSATAKPKVEEFPASTPSMFLGDANAPGNKSLREMVSPGVEESITAREASRYTEPGPLNRPVSGAGERALLGVQESTIARDASKYNEPDLPQYSKPIGPEQDFTRGMDSNYKESSGNLRSALAAGAAGGAALTGGMYLRDSQKSNEQGGQAASEEEERFKQKWRDSWTRSQIPFTEEDIERKWKATVEAKPSPQQVAERRAIQAETGAAKRQEDLERLRERQRMAGIPESQLSTALRKATPEELAAEQEARSFRFRQYEDSKQKEKPSEPPATPETSLDTKPTSEVKKEAKKAVAATDTAAKDAQTAADRGEIPQSAADRFKEERDRAYQMYNEAKSRNEWLELAQLLGQAVTQYGAARVGLRTGRDMSGIQIPGIDYGARTEREAKLLQTRLGDIGDQERLEQKEKELKQDNDYRNLKLALDRQELLDRKAERAGRLSSEQRLERTTLKDMLTKEIATAQEQYKAALTFANQAAMQKDLSPKTLKKIEEAAPGLLAKAGIDPAELQQIEKAATKEGWIWDTTDPKIKQQLIKERILDKHTNIIQGLKAQLSQLAGRSTGQSVSTSDTIPPGGKVRVRKGSEVLEIDASDLTAARDDGYELER